MPPEADCRRCRLGEGRTNLVLFCGDPSSKVALVGEAPGAQEDARGVPFVGRAGKILDGLMAEVGLDRGKVMITNTVKCRPPGNRRPKGDEMAACRPSCARSFEERSSFWPWASAPPRTCSGRRW